MVGERYLKLHRRGLILSSALLVHQFATGGEVRAEEINGDAKYIVGKDGWMFIANDTNRTLDQHSGKLVISDAALSKWVGILRNRKEIFAQRSVPYLHLIAPDTHSVYPEFLPDGFQPAKRRNIDRLIDRISADIDGDTARYLLQGQLLAKSNRFVCETTGTHWTPFGAYIAAFETCLKLRLDVPTLDLDISEVPFPGELGRKIKPNVIGRTTIARVRDRRSRKLFDTGLPIGGLLRRFKNDEAKKIRVLFQHDSYGTYMHPYLAEWFNDLLAYHAPRFDFSIYERFKPDLVISQVAERFIIAPTFDSGEGIEAIISRKSAELGKSAPDIAEALQ